MVNLTYPLADPRSGLGWALHPPTPYLLAKDLALGPTCPLYILRSSPV